MTYLLLETLLLMLAAYFLGAIVACGFKRAFAGRGRETSAEVKSAGGPVTAAFASSVPPQPKIEVNPRPQPGAPYADPRRFEKALTGTPEAGEALRKPAQEVPTAAPVSSAPAAATKPDVASPAPAAAAAAPSAAAPAEPSVAEAGPQTGDDLTRIRAIDVDLQKRLYANGVRRFDDIARWSPSDVNRFSQALGFQGRIEQENWIEQAQILAKGGDTFYARTKATGDKPAGPQTATLRATSASVQARDRLQRIIGVSPDYEALLYLNGVTRFSQIAAWTSADVERFERMFGRIGRITDENWIEQAKILEQSADPEPARPSRVAEAISETADQAADASRAPRGDLSGLRSVRSEALRGGDVGAPLRGAPRIDDLKRIRGVGVVIEKKLNSLGVTSYEQIANWTGADIDRVSEILDFRGRIERENWIEQARILASGGQTEFSHRVDRGDVESSR